MNVAVLGSSFDPPHNGHLKIAENVLRSGKVSKVILMPVNIHPFTKKLTDSKHRLAMAKLLEDKNIEISDYEISKSSTSYSIDTLRTLQERFPKDRFYWIIGSDHLNSFVKWKDWKKIIEDFGLIIVARDAQYHLAGETRKNIITLDAKDFLPLDISSTDIRKKIKEGESISNLVPKKIEEYIIHHELYL